MKDVRGCVTQVIIFSVIVMLVTAPGSAVGQTKEGSKGKLLNLHHGQSPTEETVTLDQLVNTALERNPSIRAAQQAAEAKRVRTSADRTLPDPTLSFQTMGDPFPFKLQAGDPSSGRTFSIEQEIPFPGKLDLKGKIAETEAEVQRWNAEQTRREVIADLKKAYYEYFLIWKSIEVIDEDKVLLQDFAQVAEAKYRVGQGNQQDVLKAQIEISKLIEKHAVLDQRRAISEAMLNNLLYREPNIAIGRPADIEKVPLLYKLDELFQLAQKNAPALQMQEREIERSSQNIELARKEYLPDFSVGFSVVDRDSLPEMYGLMLKAKLPLYFSRKQRPELESATLSHSSAKIQRDSIASNLSYSVKEAYTLATTSEKLMELYKTTLIPQASVTLESALASYQVGATEFLSLIDSIMTLLDYQLKYYESLTEYQKALARLEPLVGVDLTK